MKRGNPQRPAAGRALIALREALNMSQGEFAVLILDCAITTVGRYETKDPPRGKVLLRLAAIAEAQGLPALKERFWKLFEDDARATYNAAMRKVGK